MLAPTSGSGPLQRVRLYRRWAVRWWMRGKREKKLLVHESGIYIILYIYERELEICFNCEMLGNWNSLGLEHTIHMWTFWFQASTFQIICEKSRSPVKMFSWLYVPYVQILVPMKIITENEEFACEETNFMWLHVEVFSGMWTNK